jgi:glyoxylase-like metal-dependent hydrolase (beta-lactamase superfamily II)
VREAELVRYLWQEDEGWADTVTAFWHNCGMSAEVATAIVVETNRTRQRTRPHPTALQTIVPGSSVRLGNREWQTIHSPGHSDGQLMFYDAADALLLCGDHVLQKITPNISRWPFAELDPLGRYLRSLNELAALPVRLALPGHGPLITDWQGRIQQLLAHHDERLTVMAAVVNGRATPYEISQRVFDFNRLSIHEKRFAVAETLAHLDYLVWQERITQSGQPHEWLYNSKSGKS